MYPQTHFLFSLLVGMIFAKFGIFDYWVAFFVGLAGMLVDIDHFIVYVFKYKDIDFKDSFNKAVKGLYRGRSFIHHIFGFVLITLIIILLYFSNKTWFWIIGLGYYSHMFVDYVHLNVLKIREKMTIKEFGIIEKINKFEVLFDLFLIIGIILLWI